jgi:hypothetical protein
MNLCAAQMSQSGHLLTDKALSVPGQDLARARCEHPRDPQGSGEPGTSRRSRSGAGVVSVERALKADMPLDAVDHHGFRFAGRAVLGVDATVAELDCDMFKWPAFAASI